MSKASELDQTIKRYILERIDGAGYNIVTDTTKQKIEFIADCFEKEMGWRIKQDGRRAAMVAWFSGLPSACSIDFMNHKILELAETWGYLDKNASEAKQDRILENWFPLLSVKTLQLIDGYRIPKD